MKIHGFLCHWKGHEENAILLQKQIARLINLTVISTDGSLESKYPDWFYLDETAYFSEQWNKAVELFSGDIFFQIQCDAHFDDFERLFQKVDSMFQSFPIGVFEPCVEFSGLQCKRSALKHLVKNVYEVPLTDCICWFVAADILSQLPRIDLSVNYYGWGVVAAISAVSHLNKKMSVRDYDFKVNHPMSTGYPVAKALEQRRQYVESLGPSLLREIESIYEEMTRVQRLLS